MKKIYIIISKTPTILARIIRLYMRTEYSHVSLSLDDTCHNMLSFGRKLYWHPFIGGLVDEGKHIGFFKYFRNSEITILEVTISDEKYIELTNLLDIFKQNRDYYSFNILGMFLSGVNISYSRKNKYFCSQFVAHILKEAGIHDFNKDIRLVRPHDFLKIPDSVTIYKGRIDKYEKEIAGNII